MSEKKELAPISKEFKNALRLIRYSECRPTCSYCGREYIGDEDDDVFYVVCLEANRIWVWDCPCNGVRKYEDWLTHNRDWILGLFANQYESISRQKRTLEAGLTKAGVELRGSQREIDL